MPRKLKFAPGPRLEVKNFGPIQSADIEFGDLTVLVGPQATGKSILLQLLKLLIDPAQIKSEFQRAGIDWQKSFELFLSVYFGEGMGDLYQLDTRIEFDGHAKFLFEMVTKPERAQREKMFFIPAQRVLTLREGWPQAFSYYDSGVPYAVREFSEQLRLLMTDLAATETLFPVPERLRPEFRELLQKHIFPGFNLQIDAQRAQKRLVLSGGDDHRPLPFMVWSAGQREFVPLLLGLYRLLTRNSATRRSRIEWVVIEELEMGLHPRAIAVVMLMVFELVTRGYRVCISTHSPQVLDAIWALKHLRANGSVPAALLKVFDAPATADMLELATSILKKSAKVYYFDREAGATRDISDLDPSAEEEGESGWGGLSEFSGRANDEVAKAVANAGRKERV